jgi:predicted Fe-Mo cluster-binding NifX family protein
MKRSAVRIALGAALVCIVAGNAQSPAPKKTTTPSPRPKETFWQWAARFSGISANPNTLKGADDELRSGQVWVADLSTGASRKITADDGYRSPVYFPNGSDILALQGVSVVRLSSSGQRPVEVFRVAGISKLVGFSLDDADEVLALEEDDAGHVSAGRLSLRSGVITPLP